MEKKTYIDGRNGQQSKLPWLVVAAECARDGSFLAWPYATHRDAMVVRDYVDSQNSLEFVEIVEDPDGSYRPQSFVEFKIFEGDLTKSLVDLL